MATHSSILAWRIPWMEELGGLQSMGRKESDTTERLSLHNKRTKIKMYCLFFTHQSVVVPKHPDMSQE